MQLKNKTAIVTGGGAGLGHATANKLLKLGVKVAILDIRDDVDNRLLTQHHGNILFQHVDVCNENSTAQAIAAVLDNWSALDICINCAGVAPAEQILDRAGGAMPLAHFQKTIEINLIGTFNISRLAAVAMAKNKPMGNSNERGIIINTASVAAYDGQVGQAAYAASKAAIIGLNLPLARDLAPLGIRVNAIAPGVMATPLMTAMPQNVQDKLVKDIQFPKRLGLPEEFANLAVHLIENSYINAETIRLDGALRMPAK